MTAIALYIAILLMVASVVVNRIGERKMSKKRKSLSGLEKELRSLDSQALEATRALDQTKLRLSELDRQVEEAQAVVTRLQTRLEKTQTAPPDYLHVFDRLDARPGMIWTVTVKRSAAGIGVSSAQVAAWREPRSYLIVAGTQREALDRANQRFPQTSGFTVGPVGPCALFQSRRGPAVDDTEAASAAAGPRAQRPPGRIPTVAAEATL